jgi:putative tryptophan/tyrosine transport system substrate-binding protein
MERRKFMAAMAGGLLAAPWVAGAQQAGKVYRIGLLDSSESDAGRQARWNAFHQRMRELGYVEGQNVSFERRWAQTNLDRVQKLAADLVGLKVDIIVVGGGIAAMAARKATSTIPIVMTTGDPVATGLVASLGRPGGNVTGMTSIFIKLAGKRSSF